MVMSVNMFSSNLMAEIIFFYNFFTQRALCKEHKGEQLLKITMHVNKLIKVEDVKEMLFPAIIHFQNAYEVYPGLMTND